MEDTLSIQSTDNIAVSLPIAGVGSRSYAFIIDWHIRLILAIAWFFLVVLINSLADLTSFTAMWKMDNTPLAVYISLGPALFIYFFYHPVLETWLKQTPGKRIAKIKIVTLNGGTPSISAMLTRNLFRLLDAAPTFYMLGFSVAMFSKQQVRIGDMAAKTLLIHHESIESDLLDNLIDDQEDGMSLANRELLHDLLERWPELKMTMRVSLASHFLQHLDIKPTLKAVESDSALYLHEQLLLLKKDHH